MAWTVTQGTNNLTTGKADDSESSQTALAVVVCTFATLGLALNFLLNPLMLLVLHRVTSIQPTTKIFMVSLTASDLGSGLVWLLELPELFLGAWPLGGFLCAATGVMMFTTRAMGVFSLLLLTVNRYIAVSRPLRYPTLMTVFRSKVIVCSTWAAVTAICITVYGIYHPKYILESGPLKLCIWESDWRQYVSIVTMLSVLLVVSFLYVHILMIARRHARRIATDNQVGNGQAMGQIPQNVSTRSTTTVVIITGTLMVSWLPTVIILSTLIPETDFAGYRIFLLVNLTDDFLLANTWLNVIIYYLRNRDLRQTIHLILSAWLSHLCRGPRP
ncbi:adenosine receptor A2b-like [Patiria miniata]|uniref:G-protein coupled receptors family 1 profile domain-containing protein n=1 Tax=Patiria miniata TaxID=46514 RepID=A0A914BRP4_PATMI|nr:adenosine receptor A2b-like [Patiria miniata]